MTLTTAPVKWIPRDDTFGARLAMVRQRFGWNLKQASLACGLPINAWAQWESNGRIPRNFAEVAELISDATGADDYWLMTGRINEDLPNGPIGGESPLSDSNRRPPLYIVGGSDFPTGLDGAEWPDEEPKEKAA